MDTSKEPGVEVTGIKRSSTETGNTELDQQTRPQTSETSSPPKTGFDDASSVETQLTPEPPYHIFTRVRKKQLVYIVSLAGLFSPLSSNIYFPALGSVSSELGVSMSLASLTITVYMIVQGLAPSFWGSLSDSLGRRPIFIGTFIVYILSNIALGASKNFTELMVFRAIQAAGSAATISIGAGVIGDITTSAERGGLVGAFGGVRMMGQAVGPVFGGILTQFLGFRSVFWLLTILGSVALSVVIFFLPETFRPIAGNGTVRLRGIHKPLIYSICGQPGAKDEPDLQPSKPKLSWASIFSPLLFLVEKDVFITLFFGSIVYSVWSMVTSSTTAMFEEHYHLNALMIGLTFLSNGAGCVSGSFTTGIFMDRDHRKTEHEYRLRHGYPEGTRINSKTHPEFPIEWARLRGNWWIVLLFVVTTAGYGFSLRTHLAVPIILQFMIAYTATAVFSVNSALIIDLYPGASASATAVNNLMRCLMGAGGVAVIQPMIDSMTAGYAFLTLALVTAALSPLLYIEVKWGQTWRLARAERLARKSKGEGEN